MEFSSTFQSIAHAKSLPSGEVKFFQPNMCIVLIPILDDSSFTPVHMEESVNVCLGAHCTVFPHSLVISIGINAKLNLFLLTHFLYGNKPSYREVRASRDTRAKTREKRYTHRQFKNESVKAAIKFHLSYNNHIYNVCSYIYIGYLMVRRLSKRKHTIQWCTDIDVEFFEWALLLSARIHSFLLFDSPTWSLQSGFE